MNWDNLRYVLMVANKGSIAAAARELEVNRTTVLRRINLFQKDLNCRIFERGDGRYVLTPEAEKMVTAARDVENTLFNMQRQIAGHELRLEGELRVTTTDTFLASLLGPPLADFHRRYPHIVVDVKTTNNILDLDRRDADIAIRPTRSPESHLVGRRVRDVDFGIYATPEFLETGGGDIYIERNWVGFDSNMGRTPPGAWLDAKVPESMICFRADTFVSVRIAAENGIGMALLPRVLGDSSSRLVALPEPIPELTVGLWLLTHPDLMRSARVNAFYDHFSEALA